MSKISLWRKNFLGHCSNLSIGSGLSNHVEDTSNGFAGRKASYVPNAEHVKPGRPNGEGISAKVAMQSYPSLPVPYFIEVKSLCGCGFELCGG
jgi:hypothetical protein